jgi:hypothetical protein
MFEINAPLFCHFWFETGVQEQILEFLVDAVLDIHELANKTN